MSKRKPPKNLRPYATPSGRKARMVEVSHAESLLLANSEDIDAPVLYFDKGKYFGNADEMRKWRASQTTSGDKP